MFHLNFGSCLSFLENELYRVEITVVSSGYPSLIIYMLVTCSNMKLCICTVPRGGGGVVLL
jgi:hypothetical protein